MTREQWLSLKVGDIIIDRKCSDGERTVLAVKRMTLKRGRGAGRTRTSIAVNNIKSRGRGLRTYFWDSDDIGGGQRFGLRGASP